MSQKNVITIDGPAASGKSSLSRSLARKLSWNWVSTGAFYRSLGLVAFKFGVSEGDEDALVELFSKYKFEIKPDPVQTQVYIDGVLYPHEDVYSVENGTRASNVSKFPKVREAVLELQRDCYKDPGLIAEGRDCGTVIFPKAQLKIYLVADVQARAGRRTSESDQSFKQVEEALAKRDRQDSSREIAPMEAASDAWILDTSNMSLEEVSKAVYDKAKEVFDLSN